MTTYRFANNASTTLGGAISPTATSITVAAGTGARFPAPAAGQYFTATLFASGSSTGLPNEIVRVTARTGDTMTVVRGQEGTTAQSWSVGDTFANFITAGFLNQLVDAGSLQGQSGNFAVDSGTANVGVVTLLPVPVSLAALVGVPIRVKKMAAASTGAYTLNVNTLGAVPVLIGGQALEGGELVASEIYEVVYDGTNFNLISNPGTLHGDRIAANSILNAALAAMTTMTLKGNLTGGTATPYDVPLSALVALLGIGTINANSNGYWFVLGTTYVQFGYKPSTYATFNFPIPFPAACLSIVAMPSAMGRYADPPFGYPVSNSQFFLGCKASDDGHPSFFPCYWIAIGE